ncbi:hypothetical protein [Paenibacillus rubinfantis]|uniref:hypothetical protein n=1 Tax=Paenibacillus rubinfantis TaxID=1720296 RepID=UPI0011DDA6CA|nr:hypothetical protein [Paenibacillus rubinfantis]
MGQPPLVWMLLQQGDVLLEEFVGAELQGVTPLLQLREPRGVTGHLRCLHRRERAGKQTST